MEGAAAPAARRRILIGDSFAITASSEKGLLLDSPSADVGVRYRNGDLPREPSPLSFELPWPKPNTELNLGDLGAFGVPRDRC